MATSSSRILTRILVFLHLGCFIFTSNRQSKKRKISPLSPLSSPYLNSLKHKPLINSSLSFIKRIFTHSKPDPVPKIPSPSLSARSLNLAPNPDLALTGLTRPESDISADRLSSFPLRNDIYPCPSCGEIFRSANLLDQHTAVKHAVSELLDADSGKNIVRIIFRTGWNEKEKPDPNIIRILKIRNSSRILTKFEDYRESVKSKAVRNGAVLKRDERCIADGNELLRFHCSTFVCELGQNGNSAICNQQFCSVCGIIKSGFSAKLDGISTSSTSWKGHVAVAEGIEEEFKFMNLKRAMLVCRVIAGRVGCDPGVASKEDPGYDSLVGRDGGIHARMDEDEELLVFNPRAVLPCFVIVYTA
jgi:hypothetical protein